MKINNLPVFFRLLSIFLLPGLLLSCSSQKASSLSTNEAIAVKDSVQLLANNTAKDISTKGPIAWLSYFEDSPDFFMASDGVIAFRDYHSGEVFIKDTLIKQIPRINLKWANIRIDPLTPQLATLAADFHEDLTITGDKMVPVEGYFTATAHQTSKGWKYLNVHWSIKPGK